MPPRPPGMKDKRRLISDSPKRYPVSAAVFPAILHLLVHWRSAGTQRVALLGRGRLFPRKRWGMWVRAGVTAVVFRLSSEDTPALCVQLQLTELSPMERIYRRSHRQNLIEVIAFPLQSVFVKVAAGFYREQLHLQEETFRIPFSCCLNSHANTHCKSA